MVEIVMRNSMGFTLLELIVTLSIAALILTLGVPTFQEVIRVNRMTTNVNEWLTALNTARSDAIRRGVRVTVCKSDNQSTCSTTSEWEAGWLIFSDLNADGSYDSAAEELILASSGFEGNNTLRTSDNFSDFIAYLPTGESRGSSLPNGTFNICDERGASYGRALIISTTGRTRKQEGANACP